MANTRILSFSSGEVTPSLYGRVDMVKYSTGLKTCLNYQVMRHGGVQNRPGMEFVAEVKDSSLTTVLIPFIFNNSQTYVLEFGNLYMRVHKNGVQLTETAKTITGATQANPCVVTVTAHGYSNGDEVQIAGVGGMTELNNRNFKVAGVTTNTFNLQTMDSVDLDATSYSAYTSGGTSAKVYELVTPYVTADLSTILYAQSADIVTLVHNNYPQKELARTGDTSWTLTDIVFGPALSAPTGLASDSPGVSFNYKVTAVDSETGEESLPSASANSTIQTSTLTWNTVTGAGFYNVYKENAETSGFYGWIGTALNASFKDASYTPDVSDRPPEDRQPFSTTSDYPSAVSFYQQRMVYANTANNPEGVWTSRSAMRKNFNNSTPLQDDDAVTFSIVGKEVNTIRHLLDIGKLIMFTDSGEWSVEGDTANILTPSAINPKHHTNNGSGDLRPIVANGSALYVQARGSLVRDLAFDFNIDGYTGNELSIFSSHLVDGYTLNDWAYQQVPHSIVWIMRNDGTMLGMTYLREHQVFGWHRHTTDGTFERVTVVPEGTADTPYFIVKRTINGRTVRYIERMKSRQITDIVDAVFMDSAKTYDGRNTGSTTMTLSGGGTWAYDEDLTLTSSAAYFASSDVGDGITFVDSTGATIIRCIITAYTSSTVVTVRPHKTVPTSLRGVATTAWNKAIKTITGLWHLEGKSVSILSDGFVSANPNNSSYTIKTVTNGQVTLDEPHSVVHVGLPYTSDMETLNIENVSGQSFMDKKKHVSKLTMLVEATRGIFAGVDSASLLELKMRRDEGYEEPIQLKTDEVHINMRPQWNNNGRVFIRQIDPLPVAVLSVVPSGYIAR